MEIVGVYRDGEETVRALVSAKRGKVEVSYDAPEGPYVTGIGTDQVILRSVHLPMKAKKKAREALPFQLESVLPDAPEKFITLPHYRKRKGGYDVSIFAALKENVEKEGSGPFDPAIVSCIPMALARFFWHVFPEKEEALLCHIGKTRGDLVAVRGGQILAAIPIPVGTQEREKLEIALDRSLYFLQQKVGEMPHLILTGEEGLEEMVREKSGMPVFCVEKMQSRAAIAIGLGLDAIHPDGLQFRQSRLMHRTYRKWLVSTTAQSALAILLLTGVGFAIVQTVFHKREVALRNQVAHFIEAHESDMPSLRSHVKFTGREGVEGVVQTIARLERAFLRSQKNVRMYELPRPVSVVLAELVSLAGSEVELDAFSYAIEKYPKLGAPFTPHVTKITMRVRGEGAEGMKERLAASALVDEKKKISWSEEEGGYVASFYLKHRA